MLLFSFKMVIEECVVHFITISLYRFKLTTVNVVVFLYVGIRRVWFVEWNRGAMSPGVERANENGEVEKRRRDRVAWCGRQVLRRPCLLLVRESPNTLPRAFICKHGVPFVHMWLYYIIRSAEALVFFFFFFFKESIFDKNVIGENLVLIVTVGGGAPLPEPRTVLAFVVAVSPPVSACLWHRRRDNDCKLVLWNI